ncbi:hypothetical protein Clacol_007801 [Clathrus columnatus]|uniref:Uncharacterized protein n=1 Tax=Clathrus columnatus TaxID=1419009 RepID=A0AAV5AFX9_9AGAM|nr:hypothetical protein Clacol_007801 [Clathrus columnatus]
MALPTLSFRERPSQSIKFVLGRLHESIVAEMAERNEPADIDSSGPVRELDNLQDTTSTTTGRDELQNLA